MFSLNVPVFAADGPLGNCLRPNAMGGFESVDIVTKEKCNELNSQRTTSGGDYTWQELSPERAKELTSTSSWWLDSVLEPFLATIVTYILKFVSLLSGLGALILNGVVYYTVVKVSENYSNIAAINESWGVVRDMANIAFIFLLLYASIQTIIGVGGDNKKLIVNIVIIAILINFSLFFTKIVIDISNVLSVLFYDAIAPGALNATGTFSSTQAGLSNAFMQHLNLTSLYKAGADNVAIDVGGIITVGIMGSILLMIAAFVFFAVALMFIIRYVILILVIILSPLAFLGFVLPQTKKYKDQWIEALTGQAFFAPIYFMLTWITLRVLSGITQVSNATLGAAASSTSSIGTLAVVGKTIKSADGVIPTLINFIVVIVFLIASLIISKEWANKVPGGVNKLTKWATGAAGGATIGMAGRFGRNTLGRAGSMIGDSKYLKDKQEAGGASGALARLALVTGRKTAGSSFDLRATGVGGVLDAGKAQKGGYADVIKKRNEDKKKFADSLSPTGEEKGRAKIAREKLENDPTNSKNAVDPTFIREYEKEKSRRESENNTLQKKIADREAYMLKNGGQMKAQAKYNYEQETQRIKDRASKQMTDVETPLAYADSLLGIDKKKADARKAAIERDRVGAMKDFDENSETSKTAKSAQARAQKLQEGYEESGKKPNEKVVEAEEELKKAQTASNQDVSRLEGEVELARKERAQTKLPEMQVIRTEELNKKLNELEEAKKKAQEEKDRLVEEKTRNLQDAKKQAEKEREDAKRNLDGAKEYAETTKKLYEEERSLKNKQYEDRKASIKEMDDVGKVRKESYARDQENGWVTARIGKEIDQRMPDNKWGDAGRIVARAISHKGRSAAAEIRKDKKPVQDRIKEILKDEGEIKGNDDTPPPPEETSGDSNPSKTT